MQDAGCRMKNADAECIAGFLFKIVRRMISKKIKKSKNLLPAVILCISMKNQRYAKYQLRNNSTVSQLCGQWAPV
jgi:hypothetical protein